MLSLLLWKKTMMMTTPVKQRAIHLITRYVWQCVVVCCCTVSTGCAIHLAVHHTRTTLDNRVKHPLPQRLMVRAMCSPGSGCWTPPPIAPSMSIQVRLSLRFAGGVLGERQRERERERSTEDIRSSPFSFSFFPFPRPRSSRVRESSYQGGRLAAAW